MHKKIFCLFSLVMLLCGCSSINTKPVSIVNPADMSEYETYDPETAYLFEKATAEQFIEKYDSEETFVAFFGYPTCPYCIHAMPILNKIAGEKNMSVDYINVMDRSSWETEDGVNHYNNLIDRIGDDLDQQDDGPHLYVPYVAFINNGKIVLSHVGVTDDYIAGNEVTKEQETVLSDIYRSGFEALGR